MNEDNITTKSVLFAVFPELLSKAVFGLDGFVVPIEARITLSLQYASAMQHLSAPQVAVIQLYFNDRLSIAAISSQLSLSVYQVRKLKSQALHVLRLALNPIYRTKSKAYFTSTNIPG